MVAAWMVTVALAAGAAPSAYAAPAWLAQPDLSATGENASRPSVAMSAGGDAVVAWQRGSAAGFVAQAAVRPAGASFSIPLDLGPAGFDVLGTPQAAIDAAGNAAVVWQHPDGLSLNSVIEIATRPAGGSFGAPQPISVPDTVPARPQIAMNAAGDTVVAWERYEQPNAVVQATVRPAGGTFSAPVDISAAGPAAPFPHVAIDGAGNATVVWTQAGPAGSITQAATRPAGGTFSPAEDLSEADALPSAEVGVNASGETVAVWARTDITGQHFVQAAIRPAGGTFAAANDISLFGDDAVDPHVALDAAGDAVAVWSRSGGTNDAVQFATRPAGGFFGIPGDISPAGGDASAAQVAVDPAGDIAIVWQRSDGTNTIIQATARRAGAGFGAVMDLSAAGRDATAPQVALDADGDALAAWSRSDGTNTIVQASGYDPAGPQPRGLSVLTSATAGTAATYSVSPLDVFSPVDSTVWTFDDGGSAAGTSVSHAFAGAGDHTATVTMTDALGNSSFTSRVVSVVAAPPPDGPQPPPPPPPLPPSTGCPGCLPTAPRLGASIGYSAHVARRYTVITRLVVTPAPAGTTIRLRCRGRGCPFQTKTRTIAKATRRVDLIGLLKRAKLWRGAQLEIRVTKPSTIGAMATIGVRDRKRPRRVSRCLLPGSSTPSICPA